MADFYVDTAKVIRYSQDIMGTAERLRKIQDGLEHIRLDGVLDVPSRMVIERELRILRETVLLEAVKMNSMGEALETIANIYRKTEASILDEVSEGEASEGEASKEESSSKPGTDKRNWFGKFWDWLTRKEPDAYETTTLEQEKAADREMQRELWNVLQDEKYSRETWDKASIEERKKILQDYQNEVIKIYGLEDVKPAIKWSSDLTYTKEKATFGRYGNNRVTLNEQVLKEGLDSWDSYKLLGTVAHELRHAYQHEAIKHPTKYMVSKETIDIWKNNFKPGNYIQSQKGNHDKYLAQPVEADARDFEVSRYHDIRKYES